MMDFDAFALKLYLGVNLLQIPTSGYNWEFWIEKALTVGVLLWIVRDMKAASKETSKLHSEQLKEKDEQHSKQMQTTHSNYKQIIEVLSEQHQQQIDKQIEILKLKS